MDLSRTFFDFFSALVRHHVRCSAFYRHLHATGISHPLDRALRSRRRILETETFSTIWQTVSQRSHYRRRNRPETPSFEQLRAFRLATLRLVLHTNFFKASPPSLGDYEGTTASGGSGAPTVSVRVCIVAWNLSNLDRRNGRPSLGVKV